MANSIKSSLTLIAIGLLVSVVNFAIAQETAIPSASQAEQLAALDENIQPQDLGVGDPRILPDNPLYAVKGVMRGLQSIFTFNPVKKTELKLKFTNEKIIEIKKLAEKTEDPKILNKALDNYKNEVEGIEKLGIIIRGQGGQDAQKADQFLDKFIDNQIKHQKLMGLLEKKMPEEVFSKITEIKEEGAKKLVEIPLRFEDPEAFGERVEKIMERQEGSDFKHFKNLEVLLELEEKVPVEAREAIKKAQENSLKRLHGDLSLMSPEDKEKFKDYIQNIGGNEIRHLEIVDNLEGQEIPEIVRKEMGKAKEMVIARIEKRLESFREDRPKEIFLKHLESGEIENLRVLNTLEDNVLLETAGKIIEVKNKTLDNFRLKVEATDTPEKEKVFLETMKRFQDVKQFGILQEVKEILPEDKKELLEHAKEITKKELARRIETTPNLEKREMILESLAGDQPKYLDMIKEFAPSLEIRNEITTKTIEGIKRHAGSIENPEKLEIFKRKIEENTKIKGEIQSRAPEILQNLSEKREGFLEEMTKEKAEIQIQKAQNFIAEVEKLMVESPELAKKEAVVKLLENAKKHLEKGKGALTQTKLGEAFGQATSAIQNADNARRILKGAEIKREIMEKRFETTKEMMEKMKERVEGALPEIKKPIDVSACLQFTPPKSDFCSNGKILWQKDIGGCLLAPKCILPRAEPTPAPTPSTPTSKTPEVICSQVITPAQDPKTGACKNFSTPCDVPENWTKVDACPKEQQKETSGIAPTLKFPELEQKPSPITLPELKRELKEILPER